MAQLFLVQSWARKHVWGLGLLVGLLILSSLAVQHFKKPGQMSVIEAQAMDMSVMKPPVGSVPVATEFVRPSQFIATVRYSGSVAPLTEQTIYPRVEGWLTNLKVYNGDKVKAGQLLAVLDSPDLQNKLAEASYGHAAAAREVPIAQANLARMQAEKRAAFNQIAAAQHDLESAAARASAASKMIQQAEKELKSAQASHEYWKAEIRREANLLKAGAVSQQEFDSEKSQAIAAEAEVENKEAKLEEAKASAGAMRAEVRNKQAALDVARDMAQAASAALSAGAGEISQKRAMAAMADATRATAATFSNYRLIRAPFDGVVTRRITSPGTLVSPGTPIVNIVQIDQVRLQANVAEADLGSIRVGAAVTAQTLKSPRRTIHATVTSVAPLADQISRTAVVEAVVDNRDHYLVPGDYVSMEIATTSDSNAITVPTSALIDNDGQDALWITRCTKADGKLKYSCTMHPEVVSDKPGLCPKCNMKLEPMQLSGGKVAHLVTVTVGKSNGDRTEILSGLKAGDEVIYAGNRYLKEGDHVFPTKWGQDGPEQLPPPPGEAMKMKMPGMGGSDENKGSEDNMPGMDMSGGTKESRGSMPGTDVSGKASSSKDHCEKEARAGHIDHAKPAGKATGKYTCPMHPEFVTDNPNALCPKCNMKVVPRKS